MFIAPIVASSASASSGRRPLARDVLPLPFFVLEKSTSQIVVAALVSECASLSDSADIVYWKVERWIGLTFPQRLTANDYSWRSTIYHLKPVSEELLRGANATAGGSVRDYFADVAGHRFRVWPFTDEQVRDMSAGPCPRTLAMARKNAKANGVHPEVVRYGNLNYVYNTTSHLNKLG